MRDTAPGGSGSPFRSNRAGPAGRSGTGAGGRLANEGGTTKPAKPSTTAITRTGRRGSADMASAPPGRRTRHGPIRRSGLNSTYGMSGGGRNGAAPVLTINESGERLPRADAVRADPRPQHLGHQHRPV